MNKAQLENIVDNYPITPIQQTSWLRLLHRLLPLGDRFYPLIEKYTHQVGLLQVPWGQYQLLFPSQWLLPISTWYVFEGPRHIPEFQLIRGLLPKLETGTIVEVGANIGYYILELRHFCHHPIVTYEPNPYVYALLKKNIDINHLKQVDIRNRACGDENGWLTMNLGINSHLMPGVADQSIGEQEVDLTRTDWTLWPVPVVTLDHDLADQPKIALLKIDCEGFEYAVLRGAMQILERHRPFLLLEIHPTLMATFGHQLDALLSLLRPYYDFELWDFQWEMRHPSYWRFLSRYRPNAGYRLNSEAEMWDLIAAGYLITFHLIGYPKT